MSGHAACAEGFFGRLGELKADDGCAVSSDASLRLSGFRAAMNEARLYVPEYIRWGDWKYRSGIEEETALMNLDMAPQLFLP